MNRNTKTIAKVLGSVALLWFLVSVIFVKSSSDDNRPVELKR